MYRITRPTGPVAIVAAAIIAAACTTAPAATPTAVPVSPTPLAAAPTAVEVAAVPTNANEVNGAQLFQLSCASCHGADATGTTLEVDGQKIEPPSLKWSDLSQLYASVPDRGTPEQQLILAITKGQDEEGADLPAMMPRWSSLSAGQVQSLVDVIKAGPSAVTSLTGPAADLKGAALYQTACSACHGADGVGMSFDVDGQKIEPPGLSWAEMAKLYSTKPERGTPEAQLALAITKGQDEEGGDLPAMMPRWTALSQAQVDSLVEYIKATFK